jgi:GAF domain-containing protein
MPSLDIAAETSGLLTEIRAAAGVASSLRGLQEEIVAAIAQRLTHYHWTGFYMLDPADPETLVLEAFAGDPTPHVANRGGGRREPGPALSFLLHQDKI